VESYIFIRFDWLSSCTQCLSVKSRAAAVAETRGTNFAFSLLGLVWKTVYNSGLGHGLL